MTMTYRIRRLGSADADEAERAVRTFKSTSRPASALRTFLGNIANYVLVAEVGGDAVGFLLAYRLERADRESSQMFVYEIGVSEAWRRRGLASALLGEIVALARAEAMFEVFVLTSRDNLAARGLYASTGGRVEDDAAVLYVYPLGAEGAA